MGVVNCRLRKINKKEDLEEKNEKRKKKLHKKRGKKALKINASFWAINSKNCRENK